MFLILFALAIFIYYIYYTLVKNNDFWKIRKVPYIKPELLFGNYREYILMKRLQAAVASEICKKLPDEPYIGTFYGTEPALLVQDLDLIKLVLNNDFKYFTGREASDYSNKENFTNHVFFQGGDRWKVLRHNLQPFYTTAKIRNMFPYILNCCNELENFLEAETMVKQELSARSLLVKYTMDCIISCGFGVKSNCLNGKEDNPFITAGEQIFDVSAWREFKMACRNIWPSVFYKLGFQVFNKNVRNFFMGLFYELSNNRKESGTTRNDFVHLITEWRNNMYISGLCSSVTGDTKMVNIEVDDELLVAQCVGFFAAGFETTASSLGYVLYEIAKDQKVQDLLIEEVDRYFEKNNGVITYDCVNELPYMEACIDESIRLYPVLGTLTREATDDYTFPTGLQLPKGSRVHIPVYHIHRHPDHFPEPDKFLPERFFGEEKKNIKRFSYFPFGEGPRLCVGLRFAKMPMHAGLLTIFKKYRIELAQNMPLSLEFIPSVFVMHPTTDIRLKFIPRD